VSLPQRQPPEDHILPESYLRRFLGDTRSPGGDSLLHIYSHRSRAWDRVRPKQAFTRPGFLDLTDKQGHQSRILDKWAKKRESAAARLFQDDAFVAQRRNPTSEERAELAAFIAHLEIRNPALHAGIEAGLKGLIGKVADVTRFRFQNDPQGWTEHMREFEAATGMCSADLRPDDLDSANLDVTINRTWLLLEITKTFESLAKDHAVVPWRFLIADQNDDFITCDAPIRRCTHFTATGPGFANEILRALGITAFTPLSRKVVLAEVPRSAPGSEWVPAATEIVAAINHELFANANEFVFAGREQFTGHQSMTRRQDQRTMRPPVGP